MPTMINRGKELIRISPKDKKKIEYSTNEGRTWSLRCMTPSNIGYFTEITDNGKEILGMSDKGLYYSTNEGRTWLLRSR